MNFICGVVQAFLWLEFLWEPEEHVPTCLVIHEIITWELSNLTEKTRF